MLLPWRLLCDILPAPLAPKNSDILQTREKINMAHRGGGGGHWRGGRGGYGGTGAGTSPGSGYTGGGYGGGAGFGDGGGGGGGGGYLGGGRGGYQGSPGGRGGFQGGQARGGQGQGQRQNQPLGAQEQAAVDMEIKRLIKPMPMEWANPSSNFQSHAGPKQMFDFDPMQDTGLFDRLQNWTDRDRSLAFKNAVFRLLQEYINPAIPPPAIQGIRIQKATIQQIKDFFSNVRLALLLLAVEHACHTRTASNRAAKCHACGWTPSTISI
jgi:hypothetical protein